MTAVHANDPVLILIHGATLNHRMWDPVRRELDPRWRVIAVDLPGHGARSQETYTLQGAIDTVVQVVQREAPAGVVLAGDSLGGYTSLASAASLPQDRLRGLVVSGASANLQGRTLVPFLARSALFRVMFTWMGEDRLVRDKVPGLLRKFGIDEADVQAIAQAGVRLRGFVEAVAALRGVDFRSKLAAVAQPVLLINGTQDHGMVAQEASFLAVAQHGKAQRLDCAHGASLLKSSEFAHALNAFLHEVAHP